MIHISKLLIRACYTLLTNRVRQPLFIKNSWKTQNKFLKFLRLGPIKNRFFSNFIFNFYWDSKVNKKMAWRGTWVMVKNELQSWLSTILDYFRFPAWLFRNFLFLNLYFDPFSQGQLTHESWVTTSTIFQLFLVF